MEFIKSKFSGQEIDNRLSKVILNENKLNKLSDDKVNKTDMATINGQSLINGGNIIIEGGGLVDTPIVYGEVDNSAILAGEYQGHTNRAISPTSMAVGAGNIAGLKGWYYSGIDFSDKKITLSDRPTYILVGTTLINGGWSSGTPNINVGDKLSLVNNSKYDYCGEVESVNGNIITYKDELPFTELVKDEGAALAVIANEFSDGYSIYIPDRPDAGIINFGGGAFAEGGLESKASNICAHAEGLTTHAYGQYSHTEGRGTKAGYAAHAEGYKTIAKGHYSHSEGNQCVAKGNNSHAEGYKTIALGNYSHAEGLGSTVEINEATLLNNWKSNQNFLVAANNQSHAEGNNTLAYGKQSHAEGIRTLAQGGQSHSEGADTRALGAQSHTEGNGTIANNATEHAQGKFNVSNNDKTIHSVGIGESDSERKNAHEITNDGKHYIPNIGNYDGTTLEGAIDVATVINEKLDASQIVLRKGTGNNSTKNESCEASGLYSHAEGYYTTASGSYSHAEGVFTTASGSYSHAEGYSTTASGNDSHAEGHACEATSQYTHAEGKGTKAKGDSSHAEGFGTKALAGASHAEGNYTTTNGHSSHAEGIGTTTNNKGEHACGRYNISVASTTDKSQATIFSVGGGTENNPKNLFELKANGDMYITGLEKPLQDVIDEIQNNSNDLQAQVNNLQTGNTYVCISYMDGISDSQQIIEYYKNAFQTLDTMISTGRAIPVIVNDVDWGLTSVSISYMLENGKPYLSLSGMRRDDSGNMAIYEYKLYEMGRISLDKHRLN